MTSFFILNKKQLVYSKVKNNQRTEKRKHFLHTNVAGFMYWDGCEAFSRLEIGTKLELVREADNRHDADADAVAIYFKDYKLGFIPGSENGVFAQFLDMGHVDLFDVRVHIQKDRCLSIFTLKETRTNETNNRNQD